MIKVYFRFLISVICLVNVFDVQCQNIKVGKLINFHQVDSFLYRSEQPQKNDFLEIEKHGIQTVINLRNQFNDNKEIRGTKIKLIDVPINSWKINYENLVVVLKIISQSNKPVLVHCLHGADRTGCVVACYRMVFNNWSKDEAINEFLQPQFGYHDGWFPKMRKLLEVVDPKQLKLDVSN